MMGQVLKHNIKQTLFRLVQLQFLLFQLALTVCLWLFQFIGRHSWQLLSFHTLSHIVPSFVIFGGSCSFVFSLEPVLWVLQGKVLAPISALSIENITLFFSYHELFPQNVTLGFLSFRTYLLCLPNIIPCSNHSEALKTHNTHHTYHFMSLCLCIFAPLPEMPSPLAL